MFIKYTRIDKFNFFLFIPMQEAITVVLTKPLHSKIRTAYMRTYENLADGEKDEVLIIHRVKNFEILICPKCQKNLDIDSQIFLINDGIRYIAFCEECGLEEYDDFFMSEGSAKFTKKRLRTF